jgi:hypothetical protein
MLVVVRNSDFVPVLAKQFGVGIGRVMVVVRG